MKKILYITCDDWWDTDISVLPELGKKFDIEVYCLTNLTYNKYPNKTLPSYIKFHDCKFGRSKKDIRMFFNSIWYGIRLLIASYKRSTIWVFDGNLYSAYILILFASPKRTIISLHNYLEHVDARSWEKRMREFLLNKFHYFHFQSHMQEEYFKKDYPQKASFSTVMPVKDFGKPQVKLDFFNNNKRTFLFFGGIREYKRPDLFIGAANELKDKANFIIAGYCKEYKKFQKLVSSDNPMRCEFRVLDNEEIPNYFCSVDFLVLPYDDSTQSGPLLTAYNYNLPVIASSLPYFLNMVDDKETGFIFQQGNQESLVNTIEEVLKMSDGDYKRMKEKLARKVEMYKKTGSYVNALNEFVEKNKIRLK